MKTQHTPGPWRIWKSINGENILRAKSDGDYACDLFAGKGKDSQCVAVVVQASVREFRVCEANARLIASAPDLLAALKDICDNCASLDPGHLHKFGKHYQMAKSAIIRAEGGVYVD